MSCVAVGLPVGPRCWRAGAPPSLRASYLRCAGESDFSPGNVTPPVGADKTLDWQRRAARRVVVYFAHGAALATRVAIPAREACEANECPPFGLDRSPAPVSTGSVGSLIPN